MSIPTAKRYGKQIIGYPEEVVPVVTVNEWVTQYTSNPIQRVRHRLVSHLPSPFADNSQVRDYLLSLFPILTWIGRYSTFMLLRWLSTHVNQDLTSLSGDFIAGLTVGIVVVPQSMSYAQASMVQCMALRCSDGTKIATLRPEYGLYSSFVGALLYCVRGRIAIIIIYAMSGSSHFL